MIPTPTPLNLFVLARLFNGATVIPATRQPAKSMPHLKRCFDAELFWRDGDKYRLTEAGIAALATVK